MLGQQKIGTRIKELEKAIISGKGKEQIENDKKNEVKDQYKEWMKNSKKK